MVTDLFALCFICWFRLSISSQFCFGSQSPSAISLSRVFWQYTQREVFKARSRVYWERKVSTVQRRNNISKYKIYKMSHGDRWNEEKEKGYREVSGCGGILYWVFRHVGKQGNLFRDFKEERWGAEDRACLEGGMASAKTPKMPFVSGIQSPKEASLPKGICKREGDGSWGQRMLGNEVTFLCSWTSRHEESIIHMLFLVLHLFCFQESWT